MKTLLSCPIRAVAMLAVALLCANVFAQDTEDEMEDEDTEEKDPRPFKDRIFFGGGLNIGFGSVTNLGVSPAVGYKIDRNNKWSVGVGGTYNYLRQNTQAYVWETSIYGYNAFTRYKILPPLFLHAEFSHLNYEVYSGIGSGYQLRRWVPFLLVGGGYAANIGGRTSLVFTVMWDVLQDPYSPYRNGQPFIGGGFAVGF
jgi:hypothetical protein